MGVVKIWTQLAFQLLIFHSTQTQFDHGHDSACVKQEESLCDHGMFIGMLIVHQVEDCEAGCINLSNCQCYTFERDFDQCMLFEYCLRMIECKSCTSGICVKHDDKSSSSSYGPQPPTTTEEVLPTNSAAIFLRNNNQMSILLLVLLCISMHRQQFQTLLWNVCLHMNKSNTLTGCLTNNKKDNQGHTHSIVLLEICVKRSICW